MPTRPTALRRYLTITSEVAARAGAAATLAGVAEHLGRLHDPLWRGTESLLRHLPDLVPGDLERLRPPAGLDAPELLGQVYEATVDADRRRRHGVFYTPADLAQSLAAATLDPVLAERGSNPWTGPVRVCDPAAGAGALLLAAARHLLEAGVPPDGLHLTGTDLDPLALEVAGAALGLLGVPPASSSLTVADALAGPPPGPVADAVLANPPFLSQLAAATARSRGGGPELGPAAAGYSDTAALFALAALAATRPGGMIGLILPEPMVATRDSATARQTFGSATALRALWLPGQSTFAARVRVCVVVAQRTAPATQGGPTQAAPTDEVAPASPSSPPSWAASADGDEAWRTGRWAVLVSGAAGVPVVRLRTNGTLDGMAACTADFRDQFYGVAAVAEEAGAPGPNPGRPALLTSGLIDPARDLWGRRPARIGGRTYQRPCAPLDGLDASGGLRQWAERRLVPKVMVATQTKVVEAVVDARGDRLPVVPVISVVPDPDRLFHVLAVLLAPPVTALARTAFAGAALSRDALKLSARQVGALPLPSHVPAWDEGAMAARAATEAAASGDDQAWRAGLLACGAAMCEAYGVDPEPVLTWWRDRLAPAPGGRRPRS